MEFYDQFSVTTGDSPKVRYRAALTWKDLAFLGRELGEYDLAQKAFDETQSRAEMLTQQAPGNVEYQTLLFFAIQDCGQFHLHTLRDFDSAHDYFERGLNQAEKLLVEHPEHADVWMSFEMYSFRGLFQVAGKIQDEEAQRTYAFAARDVAAQLRTISVADAVYAARGMTTVLEKSDPDLAEGYLLEALEKSRPWSQPDAARRDVNARVTLLRHAMGFFEERNRKLATELASEAVELSGRLVTTFPAIRDYGLRFEDVLKWRLQILKQGDGADGSSKELIATYLQKYPKSPAVHRINTELLNESEDPVAALTQAIKAFPEQSVYYATRGMLLAEQHRMDEAIADLNEVFTHSGNGNQLRKQLRIAARGLVDAGRYEDGLALAQLARAQGDEDFNLDVTLCEANRGLERFDEALVHINTAIGKAPEQFSFYKRSALVNFKLDRFDAALAAIRKVHELNPDDFSVLQWWIRIPWVARCPDENYRRGHYRLVQLVFEENPDDLNALLMHAGMLIFEGKLEEARQDYDKAMQLADEGKQQWFRREYARHLIDAELLEEALAFSSEKIEANPENPLGYLNRVSLHIKLQDYASARADLQTALKLNATYFVAKYHAALLAIVAGDQEAYAATCQRLLGDEVAVAALKDSEQPLAAWMAVLGPRALTNFEPAIELARAAMDASPESVLSHQALGGLLLRSGQHADAIPHLRRAIALSSDPLGSVTYSEYLLAMAQHHLGDQTEATAALHRGNELARRELSDKTNPPRWNRKLTLELLRKEAEALVGGNEESRVTTENSGNDRTEPPRTPNRPND